MNCGFHTDQILHCSNQSLGLRGGFNHGLLCDFFNGSWTIQQTTLTMFHVLNREETLVA